MKKSIFLFVAICSSFIGFGQNASFSDVSLQQVRGRELIKFTTQREANVRNYRIEGSNDGQNFEVVATVPSKGSSVLATGYNYDLSPYSYTYYRVGQVGMNGQMPYSAVLSGKHSDPSHDRQETKPVIATGGAIAGETDN